MLEQETLLRTLPPRRNKEFEAMDFLKEALMQEIEMKARVPLNRLAELQTYLEEHFGPPQQREREDTYWFNGQTYLRVRREKGLNLQRIEVSTKTRQTLDGLERNQEFAFNIDICQLSSLEAFLRALGFAPVQKKLKRTLLYPPQQGLRPELSEVPPLGWFCEVEWLGPEQVGRKKILHFFQSVGLEEHIEAKRYVDLLAEAYKETLESTG